MNDKCLNLYAIVHIYSRCSTARGSCTGLVTVGLTKNCFTLPSNFHLGYQGVWKEAEFQMGDRPLSDIKRRRDLPVHT